MYKLLVLLKMKLLKLVCPIARSPSAPKVISLSSGSFIPSLAVIIPTESILVTSSYVNVPPIDTLPANVAIPLMFRFLPSKSPPLNTQAVTIPVKFALLPPTPEEKAPSKVVAVTIPDELIFLEVISPVVM